MAAEFPHFSAFRPVTSAAAAHASATLPESSAAAAAAAAAASATETGCAEVSTTVDKVEENEELPAVVAEDCDDKGNGD